MSTLFYLFLNPNTLFSVNLHYYYHHHRYILYFHLILGVSNSIDVIGFSLIFLQLLFCILRRRPNHRIPVDFMKRIMENLIKLL